MANAIRSVCIMVAALAAGNAMASNEWVLGGSSPTSGVTVAGYANTGGTATPSSTSQTIQAATSITWYSSGGSAYGWGIKNADACTTSGCAGDYQEGISPEHSIDNDGRFDMLLLSFTTSVDVDQVKMGWPSSGYDSDITVLAYTGPAPFNAATKLVGLTYTNLLGNGWMAIGNYYNVGTAVTNINGGNISSSYWLIGAYNPVAYYGSAYNSQTMSKTYDGSPDYVKLASVFTSPPSGGDNGKVPEPGTLALFGAALLGMIGLRRRALA